MDRTYNDKKTPSTPWQPVAGGASGRRGAYMTDAEVAGAYLTDAEVAEMSEADQLAKALELSTGLQRPECLHSEFPRFLNENSNCFVGSVLHVVAGTKGVRSLVLADPADDECEASPLFCALRAAVRAYRNTFRACAEGHKTYPASLAELTGVVAAPGFGRGIFQAGGDGCADAAEVFAEAIAQLAGINFDAAVQLGQTFGLDCLIGAACGICGTIAKWETNAVGMGNNLHFAPIRGAALVVEYAAHGADSFGRAMRTCYYGSDVEPYSCDHCGNRAPGSKFFRGEPGTAAVQIQWEKKDLEDPRKIERSLLAIGDGFDLAAAVNLSDAQNQPVAAAPYRTRAVILRKGAHYVALVRDLPSNSGWYLLDDARPSQPFGTWEDAARACAVKKMCPTMVAFDREEAAEG